TGRMPVLLSPRRSELPLYQAAGGEWKLTSAERKRILLNNIYGVDIDAQAVETTKLSLLLKVLEGENEQTIARQLQMFHERALPDLGDNIKCGNSLIAPDFYAGQQMTLLGEEERMRINVFDWNTEFADIMKNGGFDAVIGNPPYVRIQGFSPEQIEYLTKHYRSAVKNCDLYVSFVERSFGLLKQGGRLGKIVPNKFFKTDYGEGLRGVLTQEKAVSEIVDFGAEQVFEATTYTCLLFLCKQANSAFRYAQAEARPQALEAINFHERMCNQLSSKPWSFESGDVAILLEKLTKNSKRLLDLPADMSRGSSTGDDEVFVIESSNKEIESDILREPIFATDYGRYTFKSCGKWRVVFPYVCEKDKVRLYAEDELENKFPKAFAYLRSHQVALKERKQFKEWFGFSAPRNLELHDQAQIIVPLLANRGCFALVPKERKGTLCPMASGGFTIALRADCSLDAKYVLALLNSKLLFWKLEQLSNIFRGGWITCTKQYFGELPIRAINFSSSADKAAHDGLVVQVEVMLALQAQKTAARTPESVKALERQIAATDVEIDRQVYALYGLTEDEIKIVEDNKK
ncbi:MAG: Eco57I restriction-modification methylase domain-containing protein, partial [Verrucomicrobia bacterium]|nr:Eco57I restriction-modification methylase domain-containing protein [Verrucomicrobiota bacterium]